MLQNIPKIKKTPAFKSLLFVQSVNHYMIIKAVLKENLLVYIQKLACI